MIGAEAGVSRQSNFEALRVLCMISILVLHIWTQTDAVNLDIGEGVPYFFFVFLGYGGRLVCNCFVMIGAWFLCDSEFKSERIVNLWLQVFSYAVVITVTCALLSLPDADFVRLVQAVFPIMGRPVWFPAEYMLLLLLSPFLNRLVSWEKGKVCWKVLTFFGLGIMIPATLFPIEYTKPIFSELIWFCFLYLYIAYLKRHPRAWMDKKHLCIYGAVTTYGIHITAYILLDNMGLEIYGKYYMGHYETAFSFMTSLLLFMAFKNMDMGNHRLINFLGKNTFAVYLLHAMPCFALTVWNGIFHVNENTNNVLYIIFVVTVIFATAITVESIRKALFDKFIYTRKVYKKVCRKVDGFYHLQEGY